MSQRRALKFYRQTLSTSQVDNWSTVCLPSFLPLHLNSSYVCPICYRIKNTTQYFSFLSAEVQYVFICIQFKCLRRKHCGVQLCGPPCVRWFFLLVQFWSLLVHITQTHTDQFFCRKIVIVLSSSLIQCVYLPIWVWCQHYMYSAHPYTLIPSIIIDWFLWDIIKPHCPTLLRSNETLLSSLLLEELVFIHWLGKGKKICWTFDKARVKGHIYLVRHYYFVGLFEEYLKWYIKWISSGLITHKLVRFHTEIVWIACIHTWVMTVTKLSLMIDLFLYYVQSVP